MKITKEHVSGDWMREVLPPQEQRRRLGSVVIDPMTGQPSAPLFIEMPDYHHQTQVRSVCKECNSGWMSSLEAAAKVVLPPLIHVEPASVTATEAATLATWISKSAVMREYLDHPRTRAIPAWHRRWVHEKQSPPPGTWVWCARLTKKSKWAISSRHASLTISEGDDRVGPMANTHVSSFGFHRVWMLVFGTSSAAAYGVRDLALMFPDVFVRLWPDPYGFLWPTKRAVTDDLVEELGGGKGIIVT